jgi:DNA polymerase III delta prime subunit
VALEQYRPRNLDDLVGQDPAVRVLKGLVAKAKAGGDMLDLLFSGPPGTGKTTAALALAAEMFGSNLPGNFMELNASDARGIEVVRERIKAWTQFAPTGDAPFKFLFLEEADHLTPDAQAALRRIMEQGFATTRFILAVNATNRVHPALRSRCAPVRFGPMSVPALERILRQVIEREQLPDDEATRARAHAAALYANGDGRRALNLFISASEEGDQYTLLTREVGQLFVAGPVKDRVERFLEFVRQEGFETEDTVNAVILGAAEAGLPDEKVKNFVLKGAQCAWQSTLVTVPLLQVRAFLYSTLA